MPSALEDVKDILRYVKNQSVQNAEKLSVEIKDKIASLQQFPERGSLVKEVSSLQLRELKLYHYRIIYKCAENKVQVLTVHHSSGLLTNNPHLEDLF